ncbi:TPA: hypothetical protein QDB46_000191 [Burkholderia multivorans]|nr:hypothetical protein [Burkholderia multivorans]HDR9292506.1 hypothetical protein [Burkholderia multivorans]HDR9296521.1 hypothetical protein [Burkholderia multivorans]HDR9302392.1 hypothetical protein [Burkholderia multivorans]HDR9307986.1 hypothetical protein [Burkholderia multivorans]
MTGPFIFANNVSTTLAGAISSTSTSITLSSAANLPSSIPAGKMLVIALNDQATRQTFEVMYATAISGATLTVLRGQENTAALAWSAGDFAYSAPTMGQMQAFGQLADTNTWSGNNSFSNPVVIAPAVAGSSTEAVNQGQFSSSIGASGWKKYPDPNSPTGYMIEQWGTVTGANNTFVSFPIAFPNACLNVQVSESNAAVGTWGAGLATVHASSNKTPSGFTHWTLSWTGTQWVGNTNTCDWRAWGY